jgi:hypothetical protein
VRVDVHSDRRAGSHVRLAHRPHDTFDAGGQTGRVDVADPALLVAPGIRVVLPDLGAEHEDVLVHQHPTERRRLNGATHRLNRCHA